ncbi:hypothetical protein K505DRAFT_119036 [Melanomma pulvis-pyrius CBS 109.77]|uniref:Uncharacterized protein n=1 Tax=Melanomma pulvis-pyrius CBS 109.77 TaxID=1314802 RepID=A0A6A6WUP6_9PLEO|nr:hypothetical protein K505DRAFT_119036 [Melanomma pulvis-pyrius CBS 109.77]
MCWITLSPGKGSRKHHHHDHHDHHRHRSERGSSVEEIVRISRSSIERPRIRVVSPTRIAVDRIEVREFDRGHRHAKVYPHLHHHHPHLHPHLPHLPHLHPHHHHHHHHHPIRLHGPGKKRAPPPSPPPPSRCPSREPIYRTQVVEPEPSPREIRETTRVALREVRPERVRGRLRRVAGYEVLGRDVPWSWDAVSSVGGASGRRDGSSVGGGRRGLRFPPFGGAGSWL